eukprot:maker-scaffold367_size194084-snap-gene-0.48 protein:Tk00509 transcript:maker-scaffold367_size194084-snap-gene-0.48-mRNA-1 annotation:"hypothetical protein DAPPUDRAFT_301481"
MVSRRQRKSPSSGSVVFNHLQERGRPVSVVFNKCVRRVMNSRLSASKPSLRKSSLALHRMNSKPFIHDGFDELKNYIKQGSEFTKDLVQTLSERAELEVAYSKGLAKLSAKLFKSSKELDGTVPNAWHFIAEDMEATSDTHKTISHILTEDLVKPLKIFVEAQHRTRKSIEGMVEKRSKTLQEWRGTETKSKGKCYANCKENEKVQDQVLDCKLGRGKVLSEKELLKLDSKRKKSESAVRKSDLDYYTCCLKSERARLEMESSLIRGCTVFRQMEEERLEQLKHLAEQYHQTMADNRPKLVASSQRLQEPIQQCNVPTDMEHVEKKVNIDSDTVGDQVLPSFYAEDQTNAMNQERRREALSKFLRVIKSDIDREKKGKAGVENLAKALQETPKFGSEDSQQDVQEKLLHMRSMLTFLEACRYKVLNSLLGMEGRPGVSHPLSSFIESGKDKSGMIKTTLKLPYWQRQESQPPLEELSGTYSPISLDRGMADGGFTDLGSDGFSNAASDGPGVPTAFRGAADGAGEASGSNGEEDIDSDFDDFSDGDEHVNIIAVVNGTAESQVSSSQTESEESNYGHPRASQDNEISEIYYQEKQMAVLGQCRAIYDYKANLYDELTIQVGDVINVHDKQADGWWLGELNGSIGIFPATYVEDVGSQSNS